MNPTAIPAPTMRREKPKLSFWDIWNMSFGFLGIQFGFALQIGNTSRIFQTLGANVEDLAIYWLAGPVTGLIVQPIIGYLSDRTWHPRWGRRRPYFLLGAVLAAIALIVMPNAPALWIAIGMLWIMDSSFNIAMEPFRAYVGDKLPADQRTIGFAAQSFFIGLGAVVASLLPWLFTQLGVANQAAEGVIPNTVKWSFYLGAVAFLGAVLWTVFKTKEYSPEEMASFADPAAAHYEQQALSAADMQADAQKKYIWGGIIAIVGVVASILIYIQELKRDLYVLSIGLAIFGVLLIIAGALQRQGSRNAFTTIMSDLQHMPKTMKQLAVVQFFSWFALFAMWIYTTPAVTAHIFGSSDTSSALYNDGANWVTLSFAVYNGVAALVAFGLPVLAKLTSRKVTHCICLIIGGISLAAIYWFPSKYTVMLSMVGVGIAWASILAMPYAMLTGALPANKMGYYMGVFNFFIVIPQMVAASILGWLLLSFFNNQSILALLVGGVAMVIAGLFSLLVSDEH